MMDGGEDLNNPQMREGMIKALECTLKDRPLLPARFPTDPRQLEAAIFKTSTSKDDYMKKINKVLQLAGGGPGQAAAGAGYDMAGGARSRLLAGAGPGPGGGPGGGMTAAHRMQQQQQQQDDPPVVQHQPAPPNATISSAPLPPQPQQQQHYAAMVDPHGRMIQPPPNPYVQQQQQMVPGMLQQHPGHRMLTTTGGRGPPPGVRMVMTAEGPRYSQPMQMAAERGGEFVRVQGGAPRYLRAPMQMQSAAGHQWAPGGVGGPDGGAVVVTHMPPRHQQMRPEYQPQQPQPPPPQSQPQPQAYQASQRGPAPVQQPQPQQQQYPRHAAGPQMMGPPSVPYGGPMSSPSLLPGPSPVAGPPGGPYGQEPSPGGGYPPLPGGGHKYNAPAEPSPAAQGQSADTALAEDPGYREKIQELRMYLEPLKRMLEQHQKEGDRSSTQQQKLLRIIDIIEGKSKATLDLLLKCEDTLKRMVQPPKANEGPTKPRESSLCQPLFEAIATLMRNPSAGNQSLKRALADALPPLDPCSAKRLCAPANPDDPRPVSIEQNFLAQMARFGCSVDEPGAGAADPESDQAGCAGVPIGIRREIASLESRFRILLEAAGAAGSGGGTAGASGGGGQAVDASCTLEDRRLPQVPALKMRIPSDYPVSSPKFDCHFTEYCGSPFLDTLRDMLVLRLTKLGPNCSITSVLDNWESTVRQACLSR